MKRSKFLFHRSRRVNSLKNLGEETHIVGLGGLGMQAAMLRYCYLHPQAASKCHIIGTPNWLSAVSPEFMGCLWGQPFGYLNPTTFEIAQQLFPTMSLNQQPTFLQMSQIFIEMTEQLKKIGVDMIEEPILSVEEDVVDSHLVVTTQEGEKKVIYTQGDHIVLNAARRNRLLPGEKAGGQSWIQNTSTLYTRAFSPLAPIYIFGSGRNLDWTIRDFRDFKTPIYHIIPQKDRSRDEYTSETLGQGFKKLNLIDVRCNKNNQSLILRVMDGARELALDGPRSQCFSAMGTELAEELTKKIPERKLKLLDSHSSRYFFEGGVRTEHQQIRRLSIQDTKAPLGNFTISYLVVANVLGINNPFSANAVLSFNHYIDDIIAMMYSSRIMTQPFSLETEKILTQFTEQVAVILIHLLEDGLKSYPEPAQIGSSIRKIARQVFNQPQAQGLFNHPVEFFDQHYKVGPLLLKP